MSIGGATEAKMVANIAQKTYSWTLQASTSWCGVRDKADKTKFVKPPIMATKIPQIIAGKLNLNTLLKKELAKITKCYDFYN